MSTKFFTIRVLIDGQADDKIIEQNYPHVAERLYGSTIELLTRMDLDEEVTVQLILPDGEVEFEQTVTR